ncbi:hypothetical protein [Oceanobacillus zhaokaii]|nr:hypothetical protein [Oceanobacillus zhaokaii]
MREDALKAISGDDEAFFALDAVLYKIDLYKTAFAYLRSPENAI